ncbi:hypothetical protein CVT26_006837, partial [Gymnopilus dilepis]
TSTSPILDRFPRRLGSPDGESVLRGIKLKRNNDQPPEAMARSNSRSNGKGKEPIRGGDVDSTANFGNSAHLFLPICSDSNFAGRDYTPVSNGVSSYASYDVKRPATTEGNLNGRSKHRGSLLVAASDALGFRFGRRRPSIRQPPMPIIMPDVIEISAARRDEEVEERNRLKQQAAEAIGLGPFMVSPDSQSRESTTDEEEDERNYTQRSREVDRLGYGRAPGSAPNIIGRSPHGSSLSVGIPSQPPTGGRFRSGSVVTYNPSGSKTIAPIPPFPTSVAALSSFKKSVGLFPKYYPPSSLRIFALSKNWKNRYIILSAPATFVTQDQSPAVSYLHLFKSANDEDNELERLEINEDSVVFLSEEEVGGKRHVIKVGGTDVGAMRKEYTHEEGGHTMWLLQIPDPAVAQTWITNIKNAILGQRTVRAGLIPAHTLGNNEPRGDMDVMLSIRAQGLVTSPTATTSPRTSQASSAVTPSTGDTNPNYASSVSSQSVRSQTNQKPPAPTGAVSALKGLFSNATRPRSASRAASIESERQLDREGADESFTSMGSNLLSMLRSSTPDTQSIATIPTSPVSRNHLPFAGPVGSPDRRLDRKILPDRQPIQWATPEATPVTRDRTSKAFSIGALSLQPPPRKRWTSSTSAYTSSLAETQSVDRSRRTSFSASVISTDKVETEPPTSPTPLSEFQFGTPEQRPRASSLQSVSTLASNDNNLSVDRASLSTKRSSGTRSARRWSRQGVLPNRLTPPSEPPPAVPSHPLASTSTTNVTERAPSPNSSRGSQKSTVSGLPTFNKRASGSSMLSTNSFNTSHSHTAPPSSNPSIVVRPSSSHRHSVPPPRPAPTVALPPAPTAPTESNQDVLKPLEPVQSPPKSSFRNSVANRTFRLSMTAAPKPPPSGTLPPRPDEPDYRAHRRSSSSSSTHNIASPTTKLETIPASPIPPAKPVNPFPPPAGPLPPTPPTFVSPTIPQASPPPKRSTSIKQRLRIRSTSSPPPASQGPKAQLTQSLMASSFTPRPIMTTISPPATPIAEKITMFQNDPSFLQMHTPVLPSKSISQSFLPSTEELSEVTSLSPPPRRGSKQLLETELESLKRVVEPPDEKHSSPIEGPPKHLSLSRPGSALSNHSLHSQEVAEGDADLEEQREETGTDLSPELSPDEKSPSIGTRRISLSRPGSVVSLGIVSI